MSGLDFVGNGEVGVEVGEAAEAVVGIVPEVAAQEGDGSVALELEDVGDFVGEQVEGNALVWVEEVGADVDVGAKGDATGALAEGDVGDGGAQAADRLERAVVGDDEGFIDGSLAESVVCDVGREQSVEDGCFFVEVELAVDHGVVLAVRDLRRRVASRSREAASRGRGLVAVMEVVAQLCLVGLLGEGLRGSLTKLRG